MRSKTEPNPLKEQLLTRTKVGELWQREKQGVRCFACGHRCFIPEGFDGICKVRTVKDGELRVPWGYVSGLQLDPIEKKPFFHVLPGSTALSFGMLGCDFRCAYCQNWFTSQSLRDPNSTARPEDIQIDQIIDLALSNGAQVLTSTYNEPLITSEWAVDIFKKSKKQGLKNSYVSNGNATPEVLQYIRPYVDYYKVDLKSFQDKNYRQLGGVLSNVLDSIQHIHEMGFWLEVVSLIIPGFNDGKEELKQIAKFLSSVSPNIPWHVTAFHQDYKMNSPDNTPYLSLLKAAEIGKDAGLSFVYAGNLPGSVGDWENTYCPSCNTVLVVRKGFRVLDNFMVANRCHKCQTTVPGAW